MTDTPKSANRRAILIGAAALTGLPLLAASTQARAAGTLPKANAKYQETPKGANSCGVCAYFIAGASPAAVGQCKVVAGPIAPKAWCVLFAPKPR